ncbi:TlpA disulfide reductase family protein [Sinorhizobium meliloti]|uniref:TlpA disulfide reductase family protein n=1 Tax=Rhizobium meliloti TaxID=382 RepID=UPI000B4A20E0|nr:TlpA disulfide reductase family protein [Sinorhizobium meliloti]ASQ12697.1 alkyl hydroperoxide reductase [Sinorhizobium meliloti]MDW9615494.1 redoxin domain-containing protein [Sinorhizobium meliloti]MDW9838192.1 redoxin domain-containing protein [Sinorhizobium meliloti]MDX0042416.1 redoxin domain-containing protein [Sinorhizobium meliloti]MDX0091661.1 redoxin domain-containing protein [Sinorhizobium meliloti]
MNLSMESQAPAIQAQNWIGGEPLANCQPGKVYVLEFFSTTCGFCVGPMLNLIQLQEKYRDRGLEVVGVAAEERAATADEAQANLEAWLTEKVPRLNFRVGIDCTGEMKKLWKEASFSFGLPCSFVVDRDSRIAFIGHPTELDDVLPKVLDGSWRSSDQAKAADRKRIAKGREDVFLSKISAAVKLKDWKTALSAIEEGIALLPDSLQLRMAHAHLLLLKMRDMQTGLAVLRQLVRDAIDRNAEDWLLGLLSQLFGPKYDDMDFPSVERLAMGKELSEHILALTGLKDEVKASYYRAVAPYYYESGNKARAEELLELALKVGDGVPVPDNIKQLWLNDVLQTLANYKGEKVSHGALWAAPKENVPNGATPKAEKKNPA